ncbi:STAS domain-containing protein [Streptomyces sp. NBC_01264]|uniref:STAS domain-containing protein n=1 Tax=Streptomyces sp. NBC_01264 TaxID=2903804 RepID=UPI00224F3B1C|nr:STAS domain-containing protein [Streptomyces sp. NBC_01264]MCX4776170.1 STAS domain-containing protein [Streptomyces sp. NBC_01264]
MKDAQDRVPPVEVEKQVPQVIVNIGGEMDIDRAPLLQGALHTLITQPDCPPEVVLDLTELTFCDSSGLNAILRARLTAEAHGRHVTLHAPNRQVTKLLELTGTEQLFHITTGPGKSD